MNLSTTSENLILAKLAKIKILSMNFSFEPNLDSCASCLAQPIDWTTELKASYVQNMSGFIEFSQNNVEYSN